MGEDFWADFPQGEAGQGIVEYSLLILFIALACFATLQVMGSQVFAAFGQAVAGFTP